MFPSIPGFLKVSIMNGSAFCQMPFLHELRCPCSFYFSFSWYGKLHWLIFKYLTSLVFLEQTLLGHGILSFLCIAEFNLLIICWAVLGLCSRKILVSSFLITPLFGLVFVWTRFWTGVIFQVEGLNLELIWGNSVAFLSSAEPHYWPFFPQLLLRALEFSVSLLCSISKPTTGCTD